MYFKNVKSKEEANLLLKKLALTEHPVKGGNLATWLSINDEFKTLNFEPSEPQQEPQPTDPANAPDAVQGAAKFAATLPGCTVEICGKWAWVTGNTRENWEALKAKGFFYSAKKNACYFRIDENKKRYKGKPLELDKIKSKYGVQQLF